jgi:protease-4
LRVGLVDHIGGLDKAIQSAATLAGISDYRVVTYPTPVDKFGMLMKRFNTNTEAGEIIKASMREELGDGYSWIEQLKNLQQMNGRAMMVLPFSIKID